jgi:anti-sigma factor RsiW
VREDKDVRGADDARLVRQALGPRPDTGAQARPEPALVAAWLDGTLDEAAARPVEAWIAGDPTAATEVRQWREDLKGDAPAQPAPERFVARAQGIVRGPGRVPASRGGLAAKIFGGSLGTGGAALRWGALAAVALLLGYGGFEAGSHGIAPTLAGPAGAPQEAQLDFGDQPPPFL